ncbi:hypothetical protein [Paraliomyxa miuraensis]|uniref:hypothetical protein n=1 Tax=Paraliomyxa miuraensis TaxID=376150 RepID=UPI00225A66B4|nr:hypothetical protein [Paraliomyxa miuraensis]MCX4240168.1 hypothetical protein [Paraliomyxa miuraensis]
MAPTVIALAFIAGCNAGEVQPPDVVELTDGGYGGTGDTEADGGDPNECWSSGAPANAVRWQCEGLAEAAVFATLHIEVPEDLENGEIIQATIDAGRIDWHESFGPWNSETYDDPGIDACCLPESGGNDDGEGADETGAPPPDNDIPQAAAACTDDCVDQMCREMPRTLRELAAEIPAGVPLAGPSYRNQLRDLANWIAANHGQCYTALRAGGIEEIFGSYEVGGEWQLPNNGAWPDITEMSIRGSCSVSDWYLPEQGEPQACTGINDNNDEDPFGSGGSSMGGFDTFAPTGGVMKLEGPTILGVEASGTAPVLGLGDACPRGECSRVDAWVTDEGLELQRVLLVAPAAMEWEQDGMRLTVEGMHAMLEHPWSVPLIDEGGVKRFEIPAGEVELLFAGRVHGVPLETAVPITTLITGTVTPLYDGSHALTIDPFAVEHRDGYGTWTMQVALGDLVAMDHSPRATFFEQSLETTTMYDASPSFDPDGDPLSFEWYIDGSLVGEGATLTPAPGTGPSTLALRVSDPAGRASWSYGLVFGSE